MAKKFVFGFLIFFQNCCILFLDKKRMLPFLSNFCNYFFMNKSWNHNKMKKQLTINLKFRDLLPNFFVFHQILLHQYFSNHWEEMMNVIQFSLLILLLCWKMLFLFGFAQKNYLQHVI